MMDFLIRATVQAVVNFAMIACNATFIMLLARLHFFDDFNLPRPTWRQAFGLAIVILVLQAGTI